jgi:hypothetical protein
VLLGAHYTTEGAYFLTVLVYSRSPYWSHVRLLDASVSRAGIYRHQEAVKDELNVLGVEKAQYHIPSNTK